MIIHVPLGIYNYNMINKGDIAMIRLVQNDDYPVTIL